MENKGCCAEKPADNACSTEKKEPCGTGKCCGGIILKGAVFGGVAMFIYFMASWTLLPWHKVNLTTVIAAGNLVPTMGKAFLLYFFGAALLTKLLKKVPAGCCPVFFAMVVGLLVAAFSYLPNTIFYNMPYTFALQGMLDNFLAITLAGMAIARIVLKSGPCTMGKCCSEKGDDKKTSCH